MDLEKWYTTMIKIQTYTKANGITDWGMGKDNTDFLMEIFIKDFGLMTKSKDEEFYVWIPVICIKEIGNKEKNMDSENTHLLMVIIIRDNSSKVPDLDRENINGLMAVIMMENGGQIKWMVKDLTGVQME